MKTLGELLEKGGIFQGGIVWKVIMSDGTVWVEKPSDNGNGWYAGECYDSDYLLFEKA